MDPGPKYAARDEPEGHERKGRDGRPWIVVRKRWVPAETVIAWRTTDPVETAYFLLPSDVETPLSPATWATPLAIQRGDRVALVYTDGRVALSAPARGRTLRDMFRSIADGMAARLPPTRANAAVVYSLIAQRRTARLALVRRFEEGTLTPRDLLRDGHDFYEGNLARDRRGMWTYAVGS